MTRGRALRCVLLVVVLGSASRARAGVERSAVVNLHIVASAAEARETRNVLADLLSRIEIGIAVGEAGTQPALVDVEIDLSTGRGGPSVALATRQPRAIICRRLLGAQSSREVLIESAAEIAYAAIESRARTLGVLRADAGEPPAAGAGNEPTPAVAPPPPPEVTGVGTGDAAAIHAQATNAASTPGYGVDAAAFGEMELRSFGTAVPAVGGGAALTFGLRATRLAPSLVLALSYLQAVGSQDPAAPSNLSMVSTRLGATVDALAFRWIALELGPSLALDFVRGDGPQFMAGPGPVLMQMPGATASFSGLAVWAGATARLSIRVARSSYVFVAAGGDYQVRQPGPARPAGGGAPNGTGGPPVPWSDNGPSSSWRSSFVVGLAFTLAGRSVMNE